MQIRLDGAYFAAFFGKKTTIVQKSVKICSLGQIFATIPKVRQAAWQ